MIRSSLKLILICVCAVACTRGHAPVPTDTFFNALGAEPDSINPITARDAYSAEINSFIFDGLLTTDPDTNDWKPGLADKWESSKDGLTYTFHLRDGLQFHDGQPVTADDVKFSFDYIRDDRYKAAEKRPYYDNFIGCTKVDDHTVKFVAKKKIFNNLMVLASGGFMAILPKHFYEDPNKRFDTIIGSGPYRLLSGGDLARQSISRGIQSLSCIIDLSLKKICASK
jgi:ABC-type transport system substrate-binding protein